MGFQFIQILVFRQELREVLRSAERVQVSEYCISLQLARIFDADVSGVCKHTEYFFLDIPRFFRKVDAVAKGLAHLRFPICPRKPQARLVVRKQDLRLYKGFPINKIEFVHDLLCLLDHGHLILSHRHYRRLKRRDIRRLADRIGEEAHRDACLEISHLDLRFYSRVALQPGNCDQIHIVKRQFAQLWHLRLDKQRRFLRVQTAGKVIQRHFDNVLADFLRVVCIIRQCLSVSDHDKNIVKVPCILELYTPSQRAHIMPYMEPSCGTVSGKHDLFHLSIPPQSSAIPQRTAFHFSLILQERPLLLHIPGLSLSLRRIYKLIQHTRHETCADHIQNRVLF